jgi:DNA-binding CsgD family transcriptional regulator
LERLLGCLVEGAAVYRGDDFVYRNAALLRLLSDEPERGRIDREMAQCAALLLSFASTCGRHVARGIRQLPDRELRTARARYLIRSLLTRRSASAHPRTAVIVVQRAVPRFLVSEELRHRFGLTPRETEVSQLLARGRSTAELASQLGISIHTARRHAEHVLRKLGVHSRGAAVAMLRAE